MGKSLSYWIKERYNPQLGVYYVAYGQISVRMAKAAEKARYGVNTMHRYGTKEEYIKAINALEDKGERVLVDERRTA